MAMQTKQDMKECDVHGAFYVSQLKPEGTEVPLPFKPKKLSRLALSVRNPLYSTFFYILIGVVLAFPLTIGRVEFLVLFMISVIMGTLFEERKILREFPAYSEYMIQIPNRWFVDVKRFFFMSDEALDEIRQRLLKLENEDQDNDYKPM
mmetsp:Transcript_6803/g.6036  ORF Transcript_6803/g.6036 Transcript_6803/m.6036 type:complete len:149 (+) Transcript_6803:325-771(+)